MYTIGQVEAAILALFNDGEPEEDRLDSYDGELLVSGWTEQILVDLGVEDAEERIRWYNATMLDSEDILNLANLEFSAVPCERCEDKQLIGNPTDWGSFQGVLQDGTVEVTIEPFGINALVCSDCASELKMWVYKH